MQETDVIVEDQRWQSDDFSVVAISEQCHHQSATNVDGLAGAVAILFTDDRHIQKLNADFRGKDRPTNVLSFPSGEKAPQFIGDIALGYETCALEAKNDGLPLADHAAHLIIHGLLHLIGFDHQTDEDADEMETLETKILHGIGIADPYKVRAK